jgi:DNA-binding MarR family transcriptional regulator
MRVIEASVLLVIQANPDITQSEIGRTLGIQRANMVPLTTQLERRGLIARGPLVGRAQALRLTRKGETLASKCRAGVDAHEARFRQRFSGEEHASLVAQLRKLWEGS